MHHSGYYFHILNCFALEMLSSCVLFHFHCFRLMISTPQHGNFYVLFQAYEYDQHLNMVIDTVACIVSGQ